MNLKIKIKSFWLNYSSFIINSLIPILSLVIIFLAFYPGIMTYDGNFQWNEVQTKLITNFHPFLSTYFLFLLSKIHNTTTIVVLYQIVLFSFIWGYLCQSIKCNKEQEKIKYVFTIIISFLPIVSIYQITLWKDIMYTSYLMCIAIMLFNFSRKNYKFSVINCIVFGILCMLVFSYRFNGMIVSILIIIMLFIILLKKYKNKKITSNSMKRFTIILFSFSASLFLVIILKNSVINNTHKKLLQSEKIVDKEEVTLSSIDSYMLWIMSAHLKDENVKDKKDLEFLNHIIPINEWKTSYNPYLINNTSLAKHLNKRYLVNNVYRFRTIFIKYSKKYPFTVVSHYLKSDGLLIDPLSMKKGYVYIFDFKEWGDNKGFYGKTNSKICFIQNKYTQLINITMKKPFVIFYQPAFILYITIILTSILAKKIYDKKIWLFIVPMLINTLSLLPINLAQDLRYVYINYLTFFGILLMFIINYRKIFIRKEI